MSTPASAVPAVPARTSTADALRVAGLTGLLATFHEAGVLNAADVHAASAIGRMGREEDNRVLLATALAVRALRNGSVCVELARVHATVFDEAEEEIDVSTLPWPAAEEWLEACRTSPLVTTGTEPTGARPLRLVGPLLYLERYWGQEEVVRVSLQQRFAATAPALDTRRLALALPRLFPGVGLGVDETDTQRLAAVVSAASWVSVVAGGPGTGKTTTVARLLALLRDQPGRAPRIALAAPTGKAAARLEEAVRSAAADLAPADRDRLGELSASTLHRLLGWVPGNRTRFRHHAGNPLPHDVVVVDEMSMVSLTMMARLLEALGPEARLVLVGDPDQLSSVEAGAVLADIVGAPGVPAAALLARLDELGLGPSGPLPPHGVVQLTHTWRYGGAIDTLAAAIRSADADGVLEVLRGGHPDVEFTEVTSEEDPGRLVAGAGSGLARAAVRAAQRTLAAARAGDSVEALRGLDQHRILCAHRRGPYGVLRWGFEVERWLAGAIPGYAADGEWYAGRPLLVTANDYEIGLYNGDTGVVVETPSGRQAAFARGGAPALYAPARLDAVQTVHAMTVHRAQGSQFAEVSILLPPPQSPLLTRELLYTAVSRATERVHLVGSEAAVRRAVQRPANRASGLRGRL